MLKQIVIAVVLLIPGLAAAGNVGLVYTPGQFPWSTGFYGANFSVCGSTTKSFRAVYNHCDWGGDCGVQTCGINPYRMTLTLYRNGSPLASQTFQGSTPSFAYTFFNQSAVPGQYDARAKLEKRNPWCVGWSTVENIGSGTITVSASPAVPAFSINGMTPPADGSPLQVCASHIQLDAAATTCEPSYFVGVLEGDLYGNRSGAYEWGTWFPGQAPNGLNLQQLSTTYSYPQFTPFHVGLPPRHGSPLIGGTLPGGADRHYRVVLCTGVPSWTCAGTLLRVDGSC